MNDAAMTIFFQISQGFQGFVLDFVDWFGEPTGKWSKDRILMDGSGFNTEVEARHVGWMMFIIYRDCYGTFLSHPEERDVSYSCSNIVWGKFNPREPKYRHEITLNVYYETMPGEVGWAVRWDVTCVNRFSFTVYIQCLCGMEVVGIGVGILT